MRVITNNEVIDLPDTIHGRCPRCFSDMTGAEIHKDQRHLFDNLTHFSRVISIPSAVLNCTVAHRCPDCGFEWEVPY